MKKMLIFMELVAIAAFLLVVHYFFFNVYETKAEVVFLKDSGRNKIYEVKVDLLNSFGMKIPFRKVDFSVEVKKGQYMILKMVNNKTLEVTPVKGEKVVLKIKCKYNLADEIITIDFK
ncbi:MAG: hypothetical protein V1773_14160 [bacterium]